MGTPCLTLVAVIAVCFGSSVIAGEIEISPNVAPERSPLFLRNPAPSSVVIVLQEPPHISLPLPFPGGCFNCSTLRSNHSNLAESIFRSHAMSQKLYDPDTGSRIFYIQ